MFFFAHLKKNTHLSSVTLSIIILIFFFLSYSPVFAQSVTLQVPIPDLDPTIQTCNGAMCSGIGIYIAAFARWLVAALSMLAVLFIMIGGIVWLTAGGNSKRVTDAKKLIFDSLGGLAVVLGSVLLLGTINPSLVNFAGLGIEKIDRIDFQSIEVAENGSYDPSSEGGSTGTAGGAGDMGQGKAQSVGTGGTKGGSFVAKDGAAPMSLSESKTVKNIKIASSVVESFDAAIEEIRKTYPTFKFVGGSGQSNRGGTSCHNNGLSVDINPDQNPCGSDCLAYPGENCCWGKRGVKVGNGEFQPYKDTRSHTKEIVEIMQKYGWCWGGNWRSFRDLHHFSRCKKDCADVRVYQFPPH